VGLRHGGAAIGLVGGHDGEVAIKQQIETRGRIEDGAIVEVHVNTMGYARLCAHLDDLLLFTNDMRVVGPRS
jgi:hypothetical protein